MIVHSEKMTKKKLIFGALPKHQMETKCHQSSMPTPRPERSVVKEVTESFASTTFYRTFQEFSQRAKSLKTLCDWISKFSVARAVFKNMVMLYLLPELEVIVDDSLGFTVKVYGSYLVDDYPLYLRYRQSIKNVSNFVKELESYQLCDGVQRLELSSKPFQHVVRINHDSVSDEEEEQQQFPNKGFSRAKGCLLIIQEGEVACCVCTTYATCEDSAKKIKQGRFSKPALVSKTHPERVKLTLQEQRLKCAQLEQALS